MRSLIVLCVLAGVAGAQELAPEDPLLFSGPADGPATGAARVETEATYGARATRAFGDHVREGRIAGEAALGSRLSLSGGAGVATDAAGHELGRGAWLELHGQVVRGVRAGLGYTHDYLGRDLIVVRGTVGMRVGPVALTGEGEVDLHPRLDPKTRERADVTVSAAAAIRATRSLDAALEVTGSELEGFADANEAEGGARIAVGPTLALHLGPHLYLRGSLATIFYATRSTPVAGPASTENQGFLADVALGWSF